MRISDWSSDVCSSDLIAEPPFFEGFGMQPAAMPVVKGAHALAVFGDSVTTDHISPAGSIKESSPAGAWLKAHGVMKQDFTNYGYRRGNHDIIMRGPFPNVHTPNQTIPDLPHRPPSNVPQ